METVEYWKQHAETAGIVHDKFKERVEYFATQLRASKDGE